MIERQKEKYGWAFLFIGANIDAVETAKHFGIGADRAVNYYADEKGTAVLYETVIEAICNMRASMSIKANWNKKIKMDFKSRK